MEARAYQGILVEARDGIATLTLNNPERKNPIGPVVVNELCWALDDAKESPDVRVVVITGAGDAFSSGGDIGQMRASSPGADKPLEFKGDFVELILRFTRMGKPTIARVNGVAMGGGVGLIAACDFAVAAESAMIGTPEIKRGLFPMQIMALMMRLMPRRKLMEMILLGDRIKAQKALDYGLLSHVVADQELDVTVHSIARRLASQSPTALRMGLAAFHAQADRNLENALPFLRDQLIAILGTEDGREGVRAFLEKREPKWTGR
jgi:enoyl-CoA hydratase/carnithine racemase